MNACRSCGGTAYGLTGGRCHGCRGTGVQHVACPACDATGGTYLHGYRTECVWCRGHGRLAEAAAAPVFDLLRQRAAKVAAERLSPPPVEVRVVVPVEDAPETHVERDEDAQRAAAEAWEAAEGTQVRRRGRRGARAA